MILKLQGESLNQHYERATCPFCGTDNAERFRMSAEIVKCLDCGGVYLQQRLDSVKLRELYQEYAVSNPPLFPPIDPAEIANSPLRRNYFLNEILSYIPAKGILLDIGSSWGAFLDNARSNGFHPIGNDIVKSYCDYAKEHLGIEVSNEDFTNSYYADNSISAITLIHSLQHLPKPWEVFKLSYSILKPQGIICGIVPNIDSFASGVLEDEWEWIDPTFHQVHFSPETLRRLLEDAGYIVEKIYTTSGDFNPYLLSDIVKRLFRMQSQQEIDEKIEQLCLDGKGEEIRFFARKPGEAIQEDDVVVEPIQVMDEAIAQDEPINDEENIEITQIELKKADNFAESLAVELSQGEKIDDILYKIYNSRRSPTKVVISDSDGILPDYAINWNGVEVKSPVFSQEDLEAIIGFNAPLPSIEEEIIETVPETESANIGKATNVNYSFSRRSATGNLPDVLPSPLFLNLGCGLDVRDGFINIDLFSDDPNVIKMDIRKLDLPDACADLVLASDVLEHFSHRETADLLKEWIRVLKPGMNMLIRCPSLKLQARTYLSGIWNADVASYMIFGGQTNDGDFHCTAFDDKTIRVHLEQAGMEVIEIDEEDIPQDKGFINLNMVIKARKRPAELHIAEEIPVEIPIDILPVDEPKSEDTFSAPIPSPIEEVQEKPVMNIIWEGSQLVWHSLALINREQCSNIIDTNVAELTIIPYEKEQFLPEGNEKYEKLLKHDIRFKAPASEETTKLPYVWIRHQWPPKAEEPKGAKWIINQPWEFSTLRKDFVEIFNQADEIWTPSTFSRMSFVNSGIDFNKVQVIPNGIDPHLFTPKGEKYLIPTEKRLKFLFIGGTIFRKGIDILLEAFTKAFTAKDDVMLFIKDMGGDTFYKGQTAKDLINKIKLLPNSPEIQHYDEYMSEEQIGNLYRSCDVFVSPYRGEGFSLPTLEAMACGLPVVVTRGGATDDFVDEEVGWLIEAQRRSIGTEIDGHELTGEAYVLEPSIDELAKTFNEIYENPAYLASAGMRAAHRARTLWTWNRATMKVLSRLDVLYGTSMAKTAYTKLRDKKDGISYCAEADNLFYLKSYEEAQLTFTRALGTNDLPDKYRIHALHRLAMMCMDSGDFNMAEEYISKAQLIEDNKVDNLYLHGKMFALQGDWTSALEIYTEIFDNWKTLKFQTTLEVSLDALLCETADAFYHCEDYDNALKLYAEALKINNNNAFACLGSARCFLTINANDEARNMLDWALKLYPGMEEALELLESIRE
jgi:glycosyltransferase involved in cell wall biosynthesis/predicted SAM-dependent methyltransferase